MKSKIKIAHLVLKNHGGMSDVASSYLNFSSTLPESDIVIFICRNTRIFIPPKFKSNCFQITFEEIGPSWSLGTDVKKVRQVSELLRKKKISHIHCDYMTYPLVQSLSLKFIADIHYLLAAANKIDFGPSLKSFFEKVDSKLDLQSEVGLKLSLLRNEELERQLFRRSDLIICNSNSTLSDFKKYYGDIIHAKATKVVHVKHCLPSSIPKIDSNFVQSRQKKIVCHGRLSTSKGFSTLATLAKCIDAEICLVGADPNRVERIARAAKITNLAILPWIEDQSELYRLLSSYHVHIFPSKYEPYGLALAKSLRMGAICIANIGAAGHREQNTKQENLILVDFENRVELKKVIKKALVSSPKLKTSARYGTAKKNYPQLVNATIRNLLKF